MKAKEWEQLKNSTDVELSAKLESLSRRLAELKFRNKTTKVKNPLEIREARRTAARVKTILRMRRPAVGPSPEAGKTAR